MKPVWIILIIILAMIYIVSPIDGMPDMIPVLGWLDDTFLLGLLIYYLRYRRLPGFIMKLAQILFPNPGDRAGTSKKSSSTAGNTDAGNTDAGKTDRQTELKSPWEILGVPTGASEDDIQRAYRKAVQQYHPDKVSHLGKEFQELAQKKFVEIQEAYHILTRK